MPPILLINLSWNICCRLLGTPNEEMWPGVSRLKNWHEYPQWKPQQLSSAVPHLDESGLDLLHVSSLAVSYLKSSVVLPYCLFRNINMCVSESKLIFGLWLLQKMLRYEPSKRISAKEAMEHPYFDGIDKDSL